MLLTLHWQIIKGYPTMKLTPTKLSLAIALSGTTLAGSAYGAEELKAMDAKGFEARYNFFQVL